VEAYNHLAAQVKTVQDRKTLQERSLLGCEPKSLPYLLCQMNLLLHGLNAPQIDPHNALRFKLTEIGEKDRVDVILTNPPFGGEEEKGIQGNFPEDRQAAETALLFLQLIMRKLHRQHSVAGRPARAAVVVPNGTLFGDGVCGRIKEDLLKNFNLHTIVRLPQGVFAPYTDIPANLLFFEVGGPTRDIWYYDLPLPEGRKKYSKTAPLQFEEFTPVLAWWDARDEGLQAWKVDFADKRAAAVESAEPHWNRAEEDRAAAMALGKPIRELEQELSATANGQKAERQERLRELKVQQQAHEQAAKAAQSEGDSLYWPIYNFDLKNPNTKAGLEHADPKDLIAAMRSHESEVLRLLGEIEVLVNEVQV
jgi:type I restriction enzyme M protein